MRKQDYYVRLNRKALDHRKGRFHSHKQIGVRKNLQNKFGHTGRIFINGVGLNTQMYRENALSIYMANCNFSFVIPLKPR